MTSRHVTLSVWCDGSQIIRLPVLWNSDMPIPEPGGKDILVVGKGHSEIWLSVTQRLFYPGKPNSHMILSLSAESNFVDQKHVEEAIKESFYTNR